MFRLFATGSHAAATADDRDSTVDYSYVFGLRPNAPRLDPQVRTHSAHRPTDLLTISDLILDTSHRTKRDISKDDDTSGAG